MSGHALGDDFSFGQFNGREQGGVPLRL